MGDDLAPILQFSILCDGIAQPKELLGKLIIIGVFQNITRPGVIPQMFIVNCWVNGSGKHTQQLKILKPDLSVLHQGEVESFELASRAHSHFGVAGFVNFDLPVPGVYWIQHFLDGAPFISYPLPVLESSGTVAS